MGHLPPSNGYGFPLTRKPPFEENQRPNRWREDTGFVEYLFSWSCPGVIEQRGTGLKVAECRRRMELALVLLIDGSDQLRSDAEICHPAKARRNGPFNDSG